MDQVKLVIEQACLNAQHSDVSIRKAGEETIQEFPRHPQALEASKYILETSTESIAQFHAANTIKEIITRQTYRQSYQERLDWVNYLLSYAIDRYSTIQHHVKGAIFQTIAISTKLGWMDSKDLVKINVMATLSKLMANEALESKRLGLVLVSALLQEFLFTNGTTSLGLPLDFHHSCQASFQKSHLLQIFEMVLQCAHQSISIQNPEFASLALSCSEKILSWDFQGNVPALFENKTEVSIEKEKAAPRLPIEWKNVVLVPEVASLFFQLAHIHADQGSIGTKAISCLVQLAGIHGPVLDSHQEKLSFLSNYVESFLVFTSSVVSLSKSHDLKALSNIGDKLFAIAQISKNLFSRPGLVTICACREILPLLSDIAQITLFCLKLRLDNFEDSWFLDAIDDMLFMWASIISKTEAMSPQELNQLMQDPGTCSLMNFLSQIAFEVVLGYIEMRVIREPVDDEDEDDFDQKDVDLFSDQLLNISIMSRLKSADVLHSLVRVLGEKSAQLNSLLVSESDYVGVLMKLQEQLHWGVLIAGHVLCNGADGEMPLIPDAILATSALSLGGTTDPVVATASTIFGILDSLGYPLHSAQHAKCSPLLIETLFWFCSRWCCSYIFPNPLDYSSLSLSIQQSFGDVNGGGMNTLTFLLQKIDQQIRLWYNEPDIVESIIQLLQAISKNRMARDALFKIPNFSAVVQFFLRNVSKLPTSSHSPIIQTIVHITSHSSNEEFRVVYFRSLCDSIESSLLSLIQHPNFTTNFQSTSVREKVVISLQMLGGLALSIDESNTVVIFEALSRHFNSLVQLLHIYHAYPDVELYILTMFKDLVRNQSFDALQPTHHQLLYRTIHELIEVYAKNEVGRHRGSDNAAEEEELYEDLSVLFQVLAELITSEYEGFERETVLERIQRNDFEVNVPKVVFAGVNTLLPLVTKQMLEYPRLCLDYVYLVSLLVDYFPDRLTTLPSTLLSCLLESLLFGMNQSGMGRISDYSFKAVQTLGLYHWSQVMSGQPSGHLNSALQILLTQILQGLIYKPLDIGILNEAADCVFSLSLSCSTTLQEIFSTLLQGPSSPALSEMINCLRSSMSDQHQKQAERLAQGTIEIGWGSQGLDRIPSLRPYRKIFSSFILETRFGLK